MWRNVSVSTAVPFCDDKNLTVCLCLCGFDVIVFDKILWYAFHVNQLSIAQIGGCSSKVAHTVGPLLDPASNRNAVRAIITVSSVIG